MPMRRRRSSSPSSGIWARRTSRRAIRLEEQLDESTAQLESSFDALKERADEAADAPPSEFLQQLAGLASDFAALQTAIATTVTTLQNADVAEESKAELQQAFADAPSCQSLQAES